MNCPYCSAKTVAACVDKGCHFLESSDGERAMRFKEAIFRFRCHKLGGHIHVRCFTSPALVQTFAMNGELVFDEEEWASAKVKLSRIGEVIED